jgi:hypothetical protein
VEKQLKKILDLIPFDGSKTKLGLCLLAYCILKYYYPDLDLSQVWDVITSGLAPAVGIVLAGLLHKWLKIRDDKKWGGSV